MIHPLRVSLHEGGLKIEDYPGAVAVKRIADPVAKQLSAIALHEEDLLHCHEAIQALKAIDGQANHVVAEALWLAAIARYFKCFGSAKSRSQLNAGKVLHGQPAAALEVFKYFQDLRDKHIIHDENEFSQSFVALILNPPEAQHKVADVVSMIFGILTTDEEHVKSFENLVSFTRDWVARKREELHNRLAATYEAEAYGLLSALPDLTVRKPDVANVARRDDA